MTLHHDFASKPLSEQMLCYQFDPKEHIKIEI